MLIATLLAAAVAAAIYGTALLRLTPAAERRLVAGCLAATLPMCWLIFHGVRLPLDRWLQAALGHGAALGWIRAAYAPLTEEPAKLWPLLLPAVRRAITRETVGRYALALGLGFGLGEIFTVAGLVAARQPQVAALPWHLLGGFIGERFLTCAIHPAMTSLALLGWTRGRHLVPGLFLAVTAHFLANFPLTMARRGWLGPNPAIAQMLVSFWVLACFMAAVAWLAWWVLPHAPLGRRLFGVAICPGCGRRHARSVLGGVNAGVGRRYERCPTAAIGTGRNSRPRPWAPKIEAATGSVAGPCPC